MVQSYSSFFLLLACSAVLTQALPLLNGDDISNDQTKVTYFGNGASGTDQTQQPYVGSLASTIAALAQQGNLGAGSQDTTDTGNDTTETSPAPCQVEKPPASCNGPPPTPPAGANSQSGVQANAALVFTGTSGNLANGGNVV